MKFALIYLVSAILATFALLAMIKAGARRTPSDLSARSDWSDPSDLRSTFCRKPAETLKDLLGCIFITVLFILACITL